MKSIYCMMAFVILLAACAPKVVPPPVDMTAAVAQAVSNLLTQTAAAASPTPSVTPTPETPPLSDQEMQTVVDTVNSKIAPLSMNLVKDAATGNYYIDEGGKHVTENLTLLPTGEFQITLPDSDEWTFAAEDVSAVKPFKSDMILLHAAAWEIDQKTGDVAWIPKEEIVDWPIAMGLKSTENDIAIAWRIHELPDSFLDSQFAGADTNIKWKIIDIPKYDQAQVLVTQGFDVLKLTDTTVTSAQLPLRPFPYSYSLTDQPNTAVYFTFIKQPINSTMVVHNKQISSPYATFLSAVDGVMVSTSNPLAGIFIKIDPNVGENLGAFNLTATTQDGTPIKEVPVPVAYNPSTMMNQSSTISSALPMFQNNPDSPEQKEREAILQQGTQDGIFPDSYKYLWPMDPFFAVSP